MAWTGESDQDDQEGVALKPTGLANARREANSGTNWVPMKLAFRHRVAITNPRSLCRKLQVLPASWSIGTTISQAIPSGFQSNSNLPFRSWMTRLTTRVPKP